MSLEFLDTSLSDLTADKRTLVLVGGIATIGFGLGLMLGNSIMRRCQSQVEGRDWVPTPDQEAEKYFRLHAT